MALRIENEAEAAQLLADAERKAGRSLRRDQGPPKPKAKQAPRPRKRSSREVRLAEQIAGLGCPPPVEEYAPGLDLVPPRNHRFDFAWPHHVFTLPRARLAPGDLGVRRLAVELNGGCHRTKERFQTDMEKLNIYTSLGWFIFICSTEMVDSGEAIGRLVPYVWRLREEL